MTNPGTCAQCGRGYDPDYQLCDECQEAEDDALTISHSVDAALHPTIGCAMNARCSRTKRTSA